MAESLCDNCALLGFCEPRANIASARRRDGDTPMYKRSAREKKADGQHLRKVEVKERRRAQERGCPQL